MRAAAFQKFPSFHSPPVAEQELVCMEGVLIVDDSMFLRKWYRMVLSRNDIPIVGDAANGFEAILRYQELSPSIVLMDINMPGMGGLEALEEILKLDKGASVVMSSAMGQEAFVRKCILLGAKAFLVKPVVERVLVNTIRNVEAMRNTARGEKRG